MARHAFKSFFLLTALTAVNAYWLMGIEDFITTERLDPIVSPGRVASHVHSVMGGSNFRMVTNTAHLRDSECTSTPIAEDKSSYWFPHLYFQWANGSFSSLTGGGVIYYLFDDKPGTTTAFPDDFRMLSGDPTLRTYNASSHAQQAITFLCLDFNGVSTRHNSLPTTSCPSGIRAQINFPSCWDGKNVDSPNHKSHVAFLSDGPDSGTCSDPRYPVALPRIFMEVYWGTGDFDNSRSLAKNSSQPYVYSYGDPTGFGYHADFFNGWDQGVLQKAVDNCHCNPFGDPTCCAEAGIFTLKSGQTCRITKAIDETTTGTLRSLPGNNPVRKEGAPAGLLTDPNVPVLLSPIYVYTGADPTAVGTPVNSVPSSTVIPSSAQHKQTTQLSTSTSSALATHTAVAVPASPPSAITSNFSQGHTMAASSDVNATPSAPTHTIIPPSAGKGAGSPVLPALHSPLSSSSTCSARKGRRQQAEEKRTQEQTRSIHPIRAHHDKGHHRLMRPHAHDRTF